MVIHAARRIGSNCGPRPPGGWAGWTSASDAREAAFARYEECGADRTAAQSAAWLYEHYCFKAQPIYRGAWLRRARHRLDRSP